MTEVRKSTQLYWILTLLSFIAFVAFIVFKPEWCWVTFPFFFTSLVLAKDVM